MNLALEQRSDERSGLRPHACVRTALLSQVSALGTASAYAPAGGLCRMTWSFRGCRQFRTSEGGAPELRARHRRQGHQEARGGRFEGAGASSVSPKVISPVLERSGGCLVRSDNLGAGASDPHEGGTEAPGALIHGRSQTGMMTGTACRPLRRYTRKSLSRVRSVARASSSVMRTRQASASDMGTLAYFVMSL